MGRIDPSGKPGREPGSGGGGAGFVSPESPLLREGALSPTVGTSDLLGFDGGAGGDTTFGPADGGRIVTARGGEAGLAGSGKRIKSDRISLSAMMFASAIDHRDGLAFMLGAAWESLSALNFPFTDVWLLMLLVLEAGGVPVGEYTIKVQARDPFDEVAGIVQFGYGISKSGDILRKSLQIPIRVTIPEPGVWTFVTLHEDRELGRIPLYFKRGT